MQALKFLRMSVINLGLKVTDGKNLRIESHHMGQVISDPHTIRTSPQADILRLLQEHNLGENQHFI